MSENYTKNINDNYGKPMHLKISKIWPNQIIISEIHQKIIYLECENKNEKRNTNYCKLIQLEIVKSGYGLGLNKLLINLQIVFNLNPKPCKWISC